MYERLEHCPVCNSSDFSNSIICKDYTVSQESFVIVECNRCNFRFTNPRPRAEELDKFYESEDYISHTNSSKSVVDVVYKTVRKFALKGKLKLINKLSKSKDKKLLDVGCGAGVFLNYCAENGWQTNGVEPNGKARAIAKNDSSSLIVEKLSDVEHTNFDTITLWHVLEHIPDLNSTIETLKSLLDSKGRLIVAVPNLESWDAWHYDKHWAAYDVPRHLYHFSQGTMVNLMKQHKLKVEAILPMKLDSFYVSLLSEKYRKHDNEAKGNGYIKAVIKGYKSNRYAKKHNNNYSSLIYIIKK